MFYEEKDYYKFSFNIVMIITSSAVSAGTEVSKYTDTSYTHSSSFDGSVRVDAIECLCIRGL